MSAKTRAQIKSYFTTGLIPTQGNFEDLVDSFHNPSDEPTGALGVYIYNAASASEDTVGDWRQYGDANGFYIQRCTEGAGTKGGGTWTTKFTVDS